MNELNLVRPDLLVDSRTIAQVLENQHKNVLTLIETHTEHFEGFGTLAFETRPLPGGGLAQRYALLNEDQCYFLVSLSRNTEHVVALKAKLVMAFRQARAAASPVFALPTNMVEALRLAADAMEAKELAVTENQALDVAVPKA